MTAEAPISEWKHKSLRAHRKKVYTLGWNSEGKRLASGSVDQSVRITRVDDHCNIKQEAELRGHTDGVTNLAWHPVHPDKLASIAGQEKSVRFWDTRAAKNTATVSTPGSNLYLCYAPDGHYVAVGNREDTVSIIDIRKMKVAQKYPHKYQVNELAFSPDGKLFMQTTGQGEVEIFAFPEMRRVRAVKGHTAAVFSLALDRQQRYLATGGADAVACLWDMQDYICMRTYISMDYPIRSLSFSHDSRYLSIAGEQQVLDVENVESGHSLGRLHLRASPEDLCWNPRHHMLAYAGEYGRDGSGAEFGEVHFRWK